MSNDNNESLEKFINKLNKDRSYQKKVWNNFEFAQSEFKIAGISLNEKQHAKMKTVYNEQRKVLGDIFKFTPSVTNIEIQIGR